MFTKFLLILIIFILTEHSFSTTINGRIHTYAINDSIVEAKVQINTDTGNDDLGGATIILRYDTTNYSLERFWGTNSFYNFYNFSGGNYAEAFLTTPFRNEIWINLDLLVNDQGTIVSGADSWTDVVSIKLIPLKQNHWGGITFAPSSQFWAVYDADNSTLWEAGNFDIISFVSDADEKVSDYYLAQNYPNPFNPSTKINFTIKSESKVRLTVFNCLGELVAELINGKVASGSHEIVFNAAGMPSGMYIYKIEAENKFADSKKMLLLK